MGVISRSGGGIGPPASAPAAPPTDTGLIFLSNDAAGSDIRLQWSGADLLPRTGHTAIWRANYVQQTGFYAVTWHTSNDGTWHASTYEFGAHPYPVVDGAVNSDGHRTSGPGDYTVHYFEIAGLGANDFLASPSSPGPQDTTLVVKGVWLTQARTCEVVNESGTDRLIHTFWPDVSQPTKFIKQKVDLASLATPTSPAFIFGCSPWTVSGDANNECPSGTFRGLRLFSAALSIADIATEAAAIGNDAAASTAGQAATWYINDNPTPTDVSDKSGAGHSPSWANANRPTLYAP
jgi:hypothetical protein